MKTLNIVYNEGFYSNCSVGLNKIIDYFNEKKELPKNVDRSESYSMYKKDNIDITFDFFYDYNNINIPIIYINNVNYNHNYQFENYKNLDYLNIIPFIKKYYSPNQNIINIKNQLINTYNIDVNNCLALYYRGTDKITETTLGSYDIYYEKIKEIKKNDDTQILIQSDDANFIDFMKSKNLNFIIINENKTSYTNKGIHNETSNYDNYLDAKYFLATLLIIAESKNIICSSGNCSIWIMFFRENANNVYQYLNDNWL